MDEEQNNCPYCDEQLLADKIADPIPESGKGYAIEHGDIKAFIAKKNGKYYLLHIFTPDDGYFSKNGNSQLPYVRQEAGGEGVSANIEPPYQGDIRTENSVVKQHFTSLTTQDAFPTRNAKKTKKKLCPKSDHNKP